MSIPKRDDKEEAVDGNLVVGDDDVVPLVVQNQVLAKGKDPSWKTMQKIWDDLRRKEWNMQNQRVCYYNNVSTIKHERKYLPGIIKNAANVEIAVMVTLRSRLPPNITVQILEAPPPGEQPVTKRPSLFWKKKFMNIPSNRGGHTSPRFFKKLFGATFQKAPE